MTIKDRHASFETDSSMTRPQLDEVVSAVLLEQAALSQLHLSPSLDGLRRRPRKFAVHMVMAAYRYELSGQKALSRHCLRQAAQVYSGAGWREVRRHVVNMLGRQAFNAGEVEEAVKHFWFLVAKVAGDEEDGGLFVGGEVDEETEQHLHAGFLEDFRQAFEVRSRSRFASINRSKLSQVRTCLTDPP